LVAQKTKSYRGHLMDDQETLGQRIKTCRKEKGMSQKQLAQLSGVAQPTISALESGANKETRKLASIANALGVSPYWLETGQGLNYQTHAPKDDQPVISVDICPSHGSCGGGANRRRGHDEYSTKRAAIIEVAVLDSKGVAPDSVFALVADGDAMANHIVHNDIVFFSTALEGRLESGQIYAFQTYNGPRIKRVHHRSDGQVMLSCDHLDKTRHPDEVLSAEQVDMLEVLGEFVLRQG
jgi:phage repressor protein C with HTH and peptisase S24 domain